MRCLPAEQHPAFVVAMKDVLDVYERPFDSSFPVVRVDEASKQQLGEIRDEDLGGHGQPEHALGGQPVRGDPERSRTGTPAEARHIADRLEIHHTHKHGSWLNIAGRELGVLGRQRTDRRIKDRATLESEVAAWGPDRDDLGRGVDWRFTTADAHIELKWPCLPHG